MPVKNEFAINLMVTGCRTLVRISLG